MKLSGCFLLCLMGMYGFGQNLQLAANLQYPSIPLANIGGYVDSLSNEYALVGTYNGLDIVDVTNPANPVIKFSVPDASSDWREVKTYRKYAYVTTEGGGGLTIIDLGRLPDTVLYKHYFGDGAINGQLNTIHALHCDTVTGFLYLYGSNINYGNTLFINLNDPWNPVYAGEYVFPTGGNDAYVHDGFAMNDTLYEAHINSGFFAVVDVRNKSNPLLLATQTTPTAFTHNTWLSDNHRTLFTTDENTNSFLTAYDISDLSNIIELSRFQTTPGSGSIVHNTHILNDYAITSWYKDGVVITDVSRPRNPIQIAAYDTYPQGSGNGFNGCWGVYPFLPSKTIVASDIDNGLFVLTPVYVRGCYLEGTVKDSISGSFLIGANIIIQSTGISSSTDGSGAYRTGLATAGNYDVTYTKAGYHPKTISGVQLNNGVLTQIDVVLVPLMSTSFSGTVLDSASQQPVAGASILLEGNGVSYSATTSGNGTFSFPFIYQDSYTVYTGKWGYKTTCSSIAVTPGLSFSEDISTGYMDDFTFDFGWTVNGSSPNAWERGEPIGTYDGNNTEINPEYDVTGDCGDKCFVTDNGGAPYNAHDVDNGNTVLTSPVFDATIYANPVIKYYRRYLDINGTGTPNDTMKISISNGFTTASLENIGPNAPGNGTWVADSFVVSNFLTPTSTMHLRIEVSDLPPGNIVEGAFDAFEISGTLLSPVSENNFVKENLQAFPNPFNGSITVRFNPAANNSPRLFFINDIVGQTIYVQHLNPDENLIRTGEMLKPGIYFLGIKNNAGQSLIKITKE